MPAIDSTPTHLHPFEHPTVLLFVRLYWRNGKRREHAGSGDLEPCMAVHYLTANLRDNDSE